jgi:serine/threonine protein kinase
MLPVNAPVQWIRGDLIGAGAFGRVYAGLDEATGQLMAVKQVLISALDSSEGPFIPWGSCGQVQLMGELWSAGASL